MQDNSIGSKPGRVFTADCFGKIVRRFHLALVPLLLVANPAFTAQWAVVPSVAVEGTYTDNFTLSPEPFAETEWVTQVIPAIAVIGVGSGLSFVADYAPEITFYARGEQDDEVFHRGNIFGSAELTEDLFFIDAGARVDQYNVSLGGPITDSNTNLTGNRATVETFFASPYLVHQFGNNAEVRARYTYSIWNSDDESQFDNVSDNIDLSLGSGTGFRLLSWALTYEKSNVDYETQSDLETDLALATARRLITPTFGLLAQVGNENYERFASGESTGEKEGGTRWGVGFEWAPSPRTRVVAAGGERFFGNAYLLDLNYRTRLWALSAGYDEDITTSNTDFFAYGVEAAGTTNSLVPLNCDTPSEVERCQQEVASLVQTRGLPASVGTPINFFGADPFLQKRFQLSAALQGVRNIVIISAFYESREQLPGFIYTTGDLSVSSEIDQTGVGFAWNFPINARTFWNLDATFENNKFLDTGREDEIFYGTFGIIRQFQQRLSGSISYRGRDNRSTDALFDYTENAVTATLRMVF